MRFDDYTDEAKEVVKQANRVAKGDGHPQLTAEQVLLTLMGRPDTHGSRVFAYLGTQTETLRQALRDEVANMGRVEPQKTLHIAPVLVRIFDTARGYARTFGAPAVSTGHLLAALAYVPGTRAQAALVGSKANPERINRALRRTANPEIPGAGGAAPSPGGETVINQSAASSSPPKPRRAASSTGGDSNGEGTALQKFAIDLTVRANEGRLDPVIGRELEIRRIMEILGRRRKNNPVLIGEPGVGKTAIVEGLAQRIATGDVPDRLRGTKLLSLDMGGLIAGAKLRGDFEARLKNVLDEVRAASGKIILFLDEIHTMVGTGGTSGGGMDASSILKPALSRGELHMIGATTTREYRGSIEKDPALERRFQTVLVEEPDGDETLKILRGIKERYEVHHGVQITDAALEAAVKMSSRYVSDRCLPDKALDLIDEASSRLRLETDSLPEEIESIRKKIAQLEVEKQTLGRETGSDAAHRRNQIEEEMARTTAQLEAQTERWRRERDIMQRIRGVAEEIDQLMRGEEQAKREGDLNRAAEITYGELPEQRRKLASLEGELAVVQKDGGGFVQESVEPEDIAEVVAAWTGIPVTRLAEDETTKLLELEQRLSSRVIGQEDPIKRVANVVRRSRSGIQDPKRPLGSFLFLGPTGVGKTELVKAVTEFLFDDEQALVRLDMSEYMEKHAVARLVGAPPGYVGYEEGGQLTEAVRRRPFSVVLLDEVEKAHKEVFDILLQVLDDGRLTDSMGRTVAFNNTIIIMTSNLGSTQIVEVAEREGSYQELRDAVMDALHGFFRPEMLNRIDELCIFNRLDRDSIKKIVRLQLRSLGKRLKEQGLSLETTDAAVAVLAEEGYDPAFGARPVKRALRTLVEDPMALRIIAGDFKGATRVMVDADGEGNLTFAAAGAAVVEAVE